MSYRDDLAYIHHHGFSEFAESAAPGVVEILHKRGVSGGLVVEIGCGTGVLARALLRAGYDVLGYDSSPSMIALARETAPGARFEVGSFATISLPPCDAIIAMGEVFNYGTFDTLCSVVARGAGSLRKGGVLLFDVAERGAYPSFDEHRSGGEDWSVIAIRESDGNTLTRRVLTFRRLGDDVRRDDEVHRLALFDRDAVVGLLQEHGFRVQIRRSYGTRRLPAGHAVVVAVKR